MKGFAGAGRRVLWAVFGVVWLGVVVAGLAALAAYDNRPGASARAPQQWPVTSRLEPAHDRPTLIMLAHPRCDCTRASLAEFAELMARATTQPKAYVVFIEPAGVPRGWAQTDLWEAARRIPGVTVVRDAGSVEADLFGVETSGQTFLYSADRRLMYSGGTTGARGHAGDNVGRATVLNLLEHGHAHRSIASVFGCPLFATNDARRVVRQPQRPLRSPAI